MPGKMVFILAWACQLIPNLHDSVVKLRNSDEKWCKKMLCGACLRALVVYLQEYEAADRAG